MLTGLLVIAAAFGSSLAMPQGVPLVAATAAPQLIDKGPAGTTFVMTAAEYQRFVDLMGRASPDFVPITRKPDALTSQAVFGIDLSLRGKIMSWALDGDESAGYVLYADWNGNGDLTDDPPMRFEREDGQYALRVQRQERDGDVAYPVSMRLVLDRVVPPTKTEKQLALKMYNRTTRDGQLVVPGVSKPVGFRLTGSSGRYAQPFHSVAFDLNGNGSFETDTEVFRVSEKYVNLGDISYEFSVDPYGRSLTLTPLTEHKTVRAALTPGSMAPGFAYTDLAGRPHTLSEHRGTVVLLDFWGAWCAPCVEAAPKLVALYGTYRERGFEIVGIDALDTREKVSAFIAEHKMAWAQTMEPEKGPIQTLYRVNGFPTYFIIGRDGTIVAAGTGNTDLDREVRAALGGR